MGSLFPTSSVCPYHPLFVAYGFPPVVRPTLLTLRASFPASLPLHSTCILWEWRGSCPTVSWMVQFPHVDPMLLTCCRLKGSNHLASVPMINLPSAFSYLVQPSGQFSLSNAITAPEGTSGAWLASWSLRFSTSLTRVSQLEAVSLFWLVGFSALRL